MAHCPNCRSHKGTDLGKRQVGTKMVRKCTSKYVCSCYSNTAKISCSASIMSEEPIMKSFRQCKSCGTEYET